MFRIEYKIIFYEYDDFAGQHGFFQIKCNDFTYGEIYSEDKAKMIFPDILFDWIERLVRVAIHLTTKKYVAISDVESFDSWIEFRRENAKLYISVVRAEKIDGSKDIEFELHNKELGEWYEQEIRFEQFKEDVITKSKEYLNIIEEFNETNLKLRTLNKEIRQLEEL